MLTANENASMSEWIPSGHITGRWKKPAWVKNLNEDSSTSKISSAQRSSTCKKSLLPTLHKLVSAYLEFAAPLITMEHFKSLQDVTCPTYFEPTHDLLYHAHEAVSNLLPDGDCEEFDVIKLARYGKSELPLNYFTSCFPNARCLVA